MDQEEALLFNYAEPVGSEMTTRNGRHHTDTSTSDEALAVSYRYQVKRGVSSVTVPTAHPHVDGMKLKLNLATSPLKGTN